MSTMQLSAEDQVLLIAHQGEKAPTPKDVRRRMRQVRSTWDATERVERRLQALARFQSLLEILEQPSGVSK